MGNPGAGPFIHFFIPSYHFSFPVIHSLDKYILCTLREVAPQGVNPEKRMNHGARMPKHGLLAAPHPLAPFGG